MQRSAARPSVRPPPTSACAATTASAADLRQDLAQRGADATESSTTPCDGLRMNSVTAADYWAVADVHCAAFYPSAGAFWDPLLRLDRVVSLQVGASRLRVFGLHATPLTSLNTGLTR